MEPRRQGTKAAPAALWRHLLARPVRRPRCPRCSGGGREVAKAGGGRYIYIYIYSSPQRIVSVTQVIVIPVTDVQTTRRDTLRDKITVWTARSVWHQAPFPQPTPPRGAGPLGACEFHHTHWENNGILSTRAILIGILSGLRPGVSVRLKPRSAAPHSYLPQRASQGQGICEFRVVSTLPKCKPVLHVCFTCASREARSKTQRCGPTVDAERSYCTTQLC